MGKKHLLGIAVVIALSAVNQQAKAQGMAVNTSGAAADASAMLDVNSSAQGVLVPRMTTLQKRSISSPATGLLVYQTDSAAGFYYNSGTTSSPSWVLINSSGNVTTQGNTFNGASQLVQLNGSGQLPAISGANLTNLNATNINSGTLNASQLPSTATTQGNTFNGASQLVQMNSSTQLPALNAVNLTNLNASNIASGTLNASRLPSTATTQGNTFNGTSQLVQLDGTGAMPAVSGAALTTLNASNISSGTLNASRLPSAATTQGNTFNGASQLVQLNASSQLPAVSGVNVTNLNASNIASGTVNTARLGSGTANATTYLRGDGTWNTVSSLGQSFFSAFVTPSSTTPPFYIGFAQGGTSTNYVVAEQPIPYAMTIDGFYMYTSVNSGAGTVDAITVTLYVNGSATSLTGTVNCSTAVNTPVVSNFTGSVTVSPGDLLAWSMTHTNGTPVVSVKIFCHAH